MTRVPLFSVIIPTYNRISALQDCLRGIAALDFPRAEFQVIVVNDGGADIPSALVSQLAQDFSLRVVSQPNRGPSAARNLGAAHSQSPWLVFLDDDCVPVTDWLVGIAKGFAQAPGAIIGGETRNGLRENVYAEASQCLFLFLTAYYHQQSGKRTQRSYFTSNNLALSRRAFQAVNGFDEAMRFAEDRDFCARLVDAGFALCYVPDARVFHYRALNLKTFFRQHVSYGTGAFAYHQKRARSRDVHVRVEPLRFYAQMLQFPFQYAPRDAFRLTFLIALSQVANALGYFRARAAHNSSIARNSL